MALGTAGPPASPKQVAYLKSLIEKAGYDSFREARRPLGLTQRQGNGKFTKSEASALIDRLLQGGDAATPDGTAPDGDEPTSAERRLRDTQTSVLRGMPADLLADELARRGWTVEPPA